MRSYGQFCALSKSLDVIGGRWTLLIVRELLVEPRRFTDLREALPGIANNLLAQRLRDLEQDGLVRRRTLPPPGETVVYELTERGQALEEVVLAMVRWGAEYMGTGAEDVFRPRWLALVLRAYLPPRVPRDARVRAAVRVGGEVLVLDSADGTPRVRVMAEAPADAEVVVDADPHALLAVASGAERFRAAKRRGELRTSGVAEAARRLEALFAAISPRETVSPPAAVGPREAISPR